jgi:hypothetical protein
MRAAVVCLLACCGDNTVVPDALVADAAPDTPTPPAGCDWAELFDADNHTMPELTNLAFKTQLVMCGRVDTALDSDAFGFSLAGGRAIRVELAGELGALGVELSIVNRFGDPLTTSRFVGAHAVTAAALPAGSYGVAVRMLDETAAPIAYTMAITADVSTCHVTGAAAFTENNAPNDVVEVRFTGDPALRRVLTNGSPASTNLTIGPSVRITGTSANVDAPDEFRDRDTFAITTGTTDRYAHRAARLDRADRRSRSPRVPGYDSGNRERDPRRDERTRIRDVRGPAEHDVLDLGRELRHEHGLADRV